MRLASPLRGRERLHGQGRKTSTTSQDLAMSIVHTLIHIYKIFFVNVLWIHFFCCKFGEQSKTKTMKKIQAFILKHYPPVVIAILIAIGLFAFGMLFALIENITPNVPVHLR